MKLEYFWSNFMNLSRALEALWIGDSSGSLSDSLGAELMKENFLSGNGVVLSEACLTLGWFGFLINGESKIGSKSSSSLSWNSLAMYKKKSYLLILISRILYCQIFFSEFYVCNFTKFCYKQQFIILVTINFVKLHNWGNIQIELVIYF